MRTRSLVSLVLSLGSASLLASCDWQASNRASARQIERLSEAIGGEKAIARPGDFLLENEHFRVAILGSTKDGDAQRFSLGPGLYAGSIVDVDLQRNDPRFSGGRGMDQFAELIPTVSMNVAAPSALEDVFVLADGTDGGPAVVRVVAAAEPFLTLLSALWAFVAQPDYWMVTDYIAEPGVPWVTIRSTAVVGSTRPTEVPEGQPVDYAESEMAIIDRAIEDGLAVGDFYLSGGSLDVFAPGMGFDEDLEVFEAVEGGRNSFEDPFRYPFVASTGEGVSYGIAPREGSSFIPLFTSSQTLVVGGSVMGATDGPRFETGSAYTYERYLFVGDGDVGSITDQYLAAREIPSGSVRGVVLEEGTGLPLSHVDVFAFEPGAEKPWNQWRTDVSLTDAVADGSWGGQLPVGTWELMVHRHGRPDSQRLTVEVTEGSDTELVLESPRAGLVSFTITDEVGRFVPAKITLFREDGEPFRNPYLGDGSIGGKPEMVLFPMYGEAEVELPPGEYRAVASRGIEYELGISEPFTVDGLQRSHIDLTVQRSIDTSGWIAADFHVHAAPSHDSGVVLADRVRTMVCEGVEFFASTDHDYITDYAPTVELLGLGEWVQTAVGVETTTVEVGHFLGFPLEADFTGEVGGAMDWTGMSPFEILDELERQAQDAGFDPILFVGHPRDGLLGYFDQYGFDPYAGTPGNAGFPGTPAVSPSLLSATNKLLAPGNLYWGVDALELLGGKRVELLRTPTQPELDEFAEGEDISVYSMFERTLAEQIDLEQGSYTLGYGYEGQIDDWFTLLNLGFRFTVLGNSDTHGLTSTEAGCPRNYVMSETDDPAFLDDQAIADAVREHRVVASYGPFVQMWVDDEPIGSELVPEGDEITIRVDVQAPTWIGVDRLELYENGTLVEEVDIEDSGDPLERWSGSFARTPQQDSWYVVIVMADDDLAPVFSPVEIPYVDLQEVVVEALAGVEAISSLIEPAAPIPRIYPVPSLAVTNPIWVDLAGDGFDAPGLPEWLVRPEPPETSE